MKKTARDFNCVRCHRQVIICSACDRGNIYCGLPCSRQAHVINHRLANQRYQDTLKGRQKHAARQRRYRQREKEKQQKKQKVTDRGSPDLSVSDLLPREQSQDQRRLMEPMNCHCCGKTVLAFLRQGFLRHHTDETADFRGFSSWPRGP